MWRENRNVIILDLPTTPMKQTVGTIVTKQTAINRYERVKSMYLQELGRYPIYVIIAI